VVTVREVPEEVEEGPGLTGLASPLGGRDAALSQPRRQRLLSSRGCLFEDLQFLICDAHTHDVVPGVLDGWSSGAGGHALTIEATETLFKRTTESTGGGDLMWLQ
jgi:hypothetical protein